MQAAQAYVSECDCILGIHSYHGARSYLRACGHHGIEICKDRVIENDHIVRTGIWTSREVGDGIITETRQEYKRIVTPCSGEFVVATKARDDVVAGVALSGCR